MEDSGDGLLNRVGVTGGKHPYTTTPLNGIRLRLPYCGWSACVSHWLVIAVLSLSCFTCLRRSNRPSSRAVMPVLATFPEAKSLRTIMTSYSALLALWDRTAGDIVILMHDWNNRYAPCTTATYCGGGLPAFVASAVT